MRSPNGQQAPIHLAIYVYDAAPPPEGIPTAVSLCPKHHRDMGKMTDSPAEVTCIRCRDYMETIGIS
jgi:hypothetical protein